MERLTLIQLQEKTIARIMMLPEQGKRAAGYGMTLLNRNPRSLRAIRRAYEHLAGQMGFSAEQVAKQWEDVKDMVKLEAIAEHPY